MGKKKIKKANKKLNKEIQKLCKVMNMTMSTQSDPESKAIIQKHLIRVRKAADKCFAACSDITIR